MATIKLKAPSGGSVSLVPQDTALDVTLTLPTAGALVSTSTLGASNGASLVGYTVGGVGAVPGTVEGRLRESVSVKDFGAVGDGVTDDTVAIQTAINAMVATGGNLHFPGKHYAVRQLSVINTAYNFSMSCDGAIFYGIATTPTTAVIDICNAVDFDMLGKWRVVASSNYTAGLKIRAQAGGPQATS